MYVMILSFDTVNLVFDDLMWGRLVSRKIGPSLIFQPMREVRKPWQRPLVFVINTPFV